MKGAHVTGGALGALVGAAVAWAAQKYLGVHLTKPDATLIGSGALAAGVGLGHVWTTQGIIPAIRRGILGPVKPRQVEQVAPPVAVAPAAPAVAEPVPQQP